MDLSTDIPSYATRGGEQPLLSGLREVSAASAAQYVPRNEWPLVLVLDTGVSSLPSRQYRGSVGEGAGAQACGSEPTSLGLWCRCTLGTCHPSLREGAPCQPEQAASILGRILAVRSG